MGKKKHHEKYCCECECYPVHRCCPPTGGYGGGYGQGMPGGYGMGMGYGAGYGMNDYGGYNNCFTPLAACSQGVCIENGELLIAFVLLLIFLFSRDRMPFPC